MAVDQKFCAKHGVRYLTRCFQCIREYMDSPEGKAEHDARMEQFSHVVKTVLPFADKLKNRMMELRKFSVRVKCPEKHADGGVHWVTARIAGSRNHLHFACDDKSCVMRMME